MEKVADFLEQGKIEPKNAVAAFRSFAKRMKDVITTIVMDRQ